MAYAFNAVRLLGRETNPREAFRDDLIVFPDCV